MKIVCASSVLHGQNAFATIGEVAVLPETRISAESVRDADVLIVRSKTPLNEQMLSGSRIKFAGSAVAGMDHIDEKYLDATGVGWAAARGCNADAVADYITSVMLSLSQCHGLNLSDLALGVVGVGEVGSRVVKRATALGMRVLKNDPPREAATGETGYVPLGELLAGSDIVTLHVPLTRGGPYATHHLANPRFFEMMKPGAIFLNASRGGVTDTESLLLALDSGTLSHAALDVWEGEPYPHADLLEKADLITPHIAGYSYEGRLRGTQMVYREACAFFELSPTWKVPEKAAPPLIEIDTRGRLHEEVLRHIAKKACDVEADNLRLRDFPIADRNAFAAHVVDLRLNYPERREFTAHTARPLHAPDDLVAKIRGLGFHVALP